MVYNRTLRNPLEQNMMSANMVAADGIAVPEKLTHRAIDIGKIVMM